MQTALLGRLRRLRAPYSRYGRFLPFVLPSLHQQGTNAFTNMVDIGSMGRGVARAGTGPTGNRAAANTNHFVHIASERVVIAFKAARLSTLPFKQVKANHGSVERYEELVIERFKGDGDPDILIVVDKLLTGFDAPRNRVLYLTKKLKEHGLLQAIARVNRLYEDDTGEKKEFGHIIDYAGILGELDAALTQYSAFEGYDEADVADALHAIRKETDTLPDKHAALLDLFKAIRNQHDQEAFESSLADDLRRQDFYDRLREYAKALQLAFSSDSSPYGTDAIYACWLIFRLCCIPLFEQRLRLPS